MAAAEQIPLQSMIVDGGGDGGGGGFFLACEDSGGRFDDLFPSCAFFSSSFLS